MAEEAGFMRHSSGIVLLTLVIALVGSTSARAGVIAELGLPEIDDLQIVAFELERRTQVDIEALAGGTLIVENAPARPAQPVIEPGGNFTDALPGNAESSPA